MDVTTGHLVEGFTHLLGGYLYATEVDYVTGGTNGRRRDRLTLLGEREFPLDRFASGSLETVFGSGDNEGGTGLVLADFDRRVRHCCIGAETHDFEVQIEFCLAAQLRPKQSFVLIEDIGQLRYGSTGRSEPFVALVSLFDPICRTVVWRNSFGECGELRQD